MTGREVAQPACLDVALERLHRAAELGGRFRHGEGVIGAPHALLARRPLDGAALLDADPEVVCLELVVDDVLGQIAHGPPRRILLCGGWVMWPAPTAHVIKPWSAVGTTPAGWGAHLYGTAGAHCRTASRRLAWGLSNALGPPWRSLEAAASAVRSISGMDSRSRTSPGSTSPASRHPPMWPALHARRTAAHGRRLRRGRPERLPCGLGESAGGRAGRSEIGPGTVAKACREAQRKFLDPPMLSYDNSKYR